MATDQSTDGSNVIQNYILKLVEENWTANERALLLSTLGLKLRQEFGDIKDLFPSGIRAYLRQWPIVQIVQHPDIQEKIGVIPVGTSLSTSVHELFEKRETVEGEDKRPSYAQVFWNAFCGPNNQTYYVSFGDRGEIKISAEEISSSRNQTFYEIKSDDVFIAAPGMSMQDKVDGTHASIEKWLLKNNLDKSRFLRFYNEGSNSELGTFALLKRAFSGVSAADQARISIPLDVMLKLT